MLPRHHLRHRFSDDATSIVILRPAPLPLAGRRISPAFLCVFYASAVIFSFFLRFFSAFSLYLLCKSFDFLHHTQRNYPHVEPQKIRPRNRNQTPHHRPASHRKRNPRPTRHPPPPRPRTKHPLRHAPIPPPPPQNAPPPPHRNSRTPQQTHQQNRTSNPHTQSPAAAPAKQKAPPLQNPLRTRTSSPPILPPIRKSPDRPRLPPHLPLRQIPHHLPPPQPAPRPRRNPRGHVPRTRRQAPSHRPRGPIIRIHKKSLPPLHLLGPLRHPLPPSRHKTKKYALPRKIVRQIRTLRLTNFPSAFTSQFGPKHNSTTQWSCRPIRNPEVTAQPRQQHQLG